MSYQESNEKAKITYDIINLVRPLYKTLEKAVEDLLQEEKDITVIRRAVLEQLSMNSALTVPQIAKNLLVERQFIQRVCNDLIEMAHVQRIANPTHQKSWLMELTESGTKVISRIKASEAERIEMVVDSLDPAELAISLNVLNKILFGFNKINLGE